MAGSITQGISIEDNKQVGGVEEYLIQIRSNFNYTVGTSSTVTGATMSGGATFQSFKCVHEQSNYTVEENGTETNTTYTYTINMKFNKVTQEKINILKTLGTDKLVVIAKYYNGKYFLLGGGSLGLRLNKKTINSGGKLDDFQGIDAIISGIDTVDAIEVNSSVIASITS